MKIRVDIRPRPLRGVPPAEAMILEVVQAFRVYCCVRIAHKNKQATDKLYDAAEKFLIACAVDQRGDVAGKAASAFMAAVIEENPSGVFELDLETLSL